MGNKDDDMDRVPTDVSEVGSHIGFSRSETSLGEKSPREHGGFHTGEASPNRGSGVNWRVDAMDMGDRLAATAAAKKGSASVDSIVDLVASERERWAEEKQKLEERVDELKKEQQLRRRGFDP